MKNSSEVKLMFLIRFNKKKTLQTFINLEFAIFASFYLQHWTFYKIRGKTFKNQHSQQKSKKWYRCKRLFIIFCIFCNVDCYIPY